MLVGPPRLKSQRSFLSIALVIIAANVALFVSAVAVIAVAAKWVMS